MRKNYHRRKNKNINIAVEIQSIHANVNNIDYAQDYGVGLLLHDIFGMKGYHNLVAFKIIPPDKNSREGKKLPSVAKLLMTEGYWTPVPAGGVIVLQGAYLTNEVLSSTDENGNEINIPVISSNWMVVGLRDTSLYKEFVKIADQKGTPHYMYVAKEDSKEKEDGEISYWQNRFCLYQKNTVSVTDMKDFKEKAISLLNSHRDMEKGYNRSGLYIRGVKFIEENNQVQLFTDYDYSMELWSKRKGTAEDVVNEFLTNEKKNTWIEDINNPEKNVDSPEGTFLDLIPYQRYGTSYRNLPSQCGKDDSEFYKCCLLDELDNPIITTTADNEKEYATKAGFAPSIMLLKRRQQENMHYWNAKKTFKITGNDNLVPVTEIITDNLPEEIKERFIKRQSKRLQLLSSL